ncbi:F0F1 ATP synthase subunit A [Janibacter cremeus]|uniref:F0F1 ATP synthase subunit A n=1 Tax=Janibacter cremeus TaxID=1285192 RepID=UPI0023F8DAC0|nr:F0F1 ATP synthase subunit A [Janibacter cremeus]WEV78341.1 F0F1 ATP synthase subunit A [Janibacter cremeus]
MTLTALAPTLAAAGGGESYQPPTPEIFWQPLFEVGGLTITNQMAWAAIITAVLSFAMIALSKRAAVLPSKGQWLFEGFYNFPRNSIARDMIGTKEFRRFVPLLFTLFTMVLFYNLAGSFFLTMNPVSGKVAFPIALTLVVYVVYHWVGIQRMGLGGYFKHMIPPGLPGWIVPFVFLLELVTYLITRPLTLALRLFGNMFAGHMVIYLFVTGAFFFLLHGDGVLLRLLSLPTFAMAGVMVLFEILVQFLQAFVFALLAASYIAGAVAEEHIPDDVAGAH